MPSADEVRAISDWLTDMGLRGTSELELFEGFCQRVDALGFELARASVGSDLLHPVHTGRAFVWRKGEGAQKEDFDASKDEETRAAWERSPYRHMIDNEIETMRQPLGESFSRDRFPLLDELADQGCTEYVARAVQFGERASFGDMRGILCSMATERPGGFDPGQLAALDSLTKIFAWAYKTISTVTAGRTLMTTYLGRDAGERVLRGEIRRGEAEPVRTILWNSDLRGFTRLADSIPRDALIALLNDYAETVVEVVQGHGGDVLKFMGDGILAMFPVVDCERALDAAEEAMRQIEALGKVRASRGEPATNFYLSMHLGEVAFGNIGSRERLDFTVIGPAVNELSRIGGMCRSLDQTVVVSSAFRQAAGSDCARLVSLGRYALRGVGRPQELFTLDWPAEEAAEEAQANKLSSEVSSEPASMALPRASAGHK